MYALIALVGLYALLWVPYLGHWIVHGIMHLFTHQLHHHEKGWMVGLSLFLWLLLLFLPLALLFRLWFVAGDLAAVLLILTRLFGTFSKH